MLKMLARLVASAFALLGGWVLLINLIELSYTGATLAWILSAGFVGFLGGVLYLLTIDGPRRFRTRPARLSGWLGMLALALFPSSLSIVLIPLVLTLIPSLFVPPSSAVTT